MNSTKRISFSQLNFALICWALQTPLNAAPVVYGDFDWRTEGGNWVTPVKNQRTCGSCWAFAATAALESQFLLNDGTPGVDLDLSEQHLLSDGREPPRIGDCQGGFEFRALRYFLHEGITDEATLPYNGHEPSPLWPLQPPYTLYKTDAVQTYIDEGDTTAGIQQWLRDSGPLITFFDTEDWFDPSPVLPGTNVPAGFGIPEYYEQNGAGGVLDPLGDAGNPGFHTVVIVGYKDEAAVPGGGFWIVKNSWGDLWGDEGYGFIEYGNIEKYNRTHAITGNTFSEFVPVPEPAAGTLWQIFVIMSFTLIGPRHRTHG